MHRHDAAARPRRSRRRRGPGGRGSPRGRRRPVRRGSGRWRVRSSPRSALSHRVRPSMRTGSEASVAARAAARSAPTSIVGQEAGRSRRWRAMRSSSSGSPGQRRRRGTTRGRRRPAAGSSARPEPALAAARPAEGEDQGLAMATSDAGHGAITAITARATSAPSASISTTRPGRRRRAGPHARRSSAVHDEADRRCR